MAMLQAKVGSPGALFAALVDGDLAGGGGVTLERSVAILGGDGD